MNEEILETLDVTVRPEHCKFILDHLAHGVFTVDEHRRVTFFNSAAEEITGYGRAEVIGRHCYEIFKNRNCRDYCKLDEAVEVGRRMLNFDLHIENPEGLSIPINISVVPILDENGKLIGGIESFEDRSLVHELLRNIRASNDRFKMVLDTMPPAVVTLDTSRRIQSFNKAAEQLTGYKREEAIGHFCRDIFKAARCKKDCLFDNLLREGDCRANKYETEVTDRNGHTIPVRVACSPLRNDSGKIVGAVETFDNLSLIHELQREIKGRYRLGDMVGQGPKMQKIFELLPLVAQGNSTILITGPTGTGKDVLARIIQGLGDRADKEFVKVNCASLPDTLLESEMFGYKKGAFTGAVSDKPGLFQLADKGTIFLDEIGDLPLSLQAKLLRVLEDQEFFPLGGRKTVHVDVRILAATNQELEKLVEEKRFRADLFYRLNVVNFRLPPLVERREDVPLLIQYMLEKLNLKNKKAITEIRPEAMQVLLNHDYPGNIRELKNILEHAYILCQGSSIGLHQLPLYIQESVQEIPPVESEAPAEAEAENGLDQAERQAILSALHRHQGNKKSTASSLNIDRTTLWRKMRKYGITK